MLEEKNSAVLKSFLALSSTIRGISAVKFIQQILEAPYLYVYGEFLACPRIDELKDTEHKSYHDLLKLFAYGNCADYFANKASLPELTSLMVKKLRHLTLASLAGQSRQLDYKVLLQQLDIQNVRELEDLIIEAIYGGVLKARIDQSNQLLHVQCAMGRDIEPSQIHEIYEKLELWSHVCLEALTDLDEQVKSAHQQKTDHNSRETERQIEITNLKKTLKLVSSTSDKPSSSTTVDDIRPKKTPKLKGLRGSAK